MKKTNQVSKKNEIFRHLFDVYIFQLFFIFFIFFIGALFKALDITLFLIACLNIAFIIGSIKNENYNLFEKIYQILLNIALLSLIIYQYI